MEHFYTKIYLFVWNSNVTEVLLDLEILGKVKQDRIFQTEGEYNSPLAKVWR